MRRGKFQFGLRALMVAVALVAVDCWLFTVGPLAAILGMCVSKHVLVAYLCMQMDRAAKWDERASTAGVASGAAGTSARGARTGLVKAA